MPLKICSTIFIFTGCGGQHWEESASGWEDCFFPGDSVWVTTISRSYCVAKPPLA